MKLVHMCVAIALGATLLGASPAVAETVKVKISTFTPAQGLMARQILGPWMADVEKAAGGDIAFETYFGGTLGRDPAQQLKLVLDGVTDIVHVVPHYTVGRFPDDGLFNLPNLIRSSEEGSRAYWRMYERGLMRGFDGVRVVGVFTTGPASIHTKPAIKGLDDVKGLKLRTSGAGFTEAARLLGGVAVPLPATKIAENISRGLIDGTMLDFVAIVLFRVTKTTSYHVDYNLGVITNLIVINEGAYGKLSDRAKAAIARYGGEAFATRNGRFNDNFGAKTMADLKKDRAHHVIVPTPEQRQRWDAMLAPMHAAWRKNNPKGDQLYNTLTGILADLRAGK